MGDHIIEVRKHIMVLKSKYFKSESNGESITPPEFCFADFYFCTGNLRTVNFVVMSTNMFSSSV